MNFVRDVSFDAFDEEKVQVSCIFTTMEYKTDKIFAVFFSYKYGL